MSTNYARLYRAWTPVSGRQRIAVSGDARCLGMTLLELLVVLGIIAVLATLSVSGYLAWKRRAMLSACLTEVSLRLREARNFAISGAVPAVVYVDAAQNNIESYSFRPVVRVDFEKGGQAASLAASGAVSLEEGRIGKGALLRSGSTVELRSVGGFIGPEGFAVSLFLLPARLPTRDDPQWYLLKGGEDFALSITPEGGFELRLGSWKGRTRGAVLVPGRWQEIRVIWRAVCGKTLRITWDGIPVSLRSESTRSFSRFPVPVDPGKAVLLPGGLTVGPLEGVVDEIVVYTVVAGKEYGIPGEFFIIGPSRTVHFAPSGCLDVRYHEKPVEISIAPSAYLEKEPSGRTVAVGSSSRVEVPPEMLSRVVVELSGRIRILKAPKAFAPPPPGAAEAMQKKNR